MPMLWTARGESLLAGFLKQGDCQADAISQKDGNKHNNPQNYSRNYP